MAQPSNTLLKKLAKPEKRFKHTSPNFITSRTEFSRDLGKSIVMQIDARQAFHFAARVESFTEVMMESNLTEEQKEEGKELLNILAKTAGDHITVMMR